MADIQLVLLLWSVCILVPRTTNGDQCVQNLRNIAVYEGKENTTMNLAVDPRNVKWEIFATSDELSQYTIWDFGNYSNPSLNELYDVSQTGLIIKNATTTENGHPIATSGLYIAHCDDNTNKTGAKLLVVRSGPKCSRNSTSVSCNVTYADSTIHPIYPIVTWKLNGAFLSTETLQRERIDSYVFHVVSTKPATGGSADNYECELSFSAPTDIQYSWVVTNAPEFNKSCSI